MSKGDVHVVPRRTGWRIELEGSERARATHARQLAATTAAREIARQNKSELLIHGPNGRIRERNTYGRDHRTIKG